MASIASTGIPTQEAKTLYPTVGKKEMNSQDFLKLFITQLQYQDPSKPMDSYEMSAQLAQFSSMEATMKMSTNIEKMVKFQTSQNNLQLLSLLDKNVLAKGNGVGVESGVATPAEFDLAAKANTCVIEVYNDANQLVQKIDRGELSVGTYQFAWDGKDLRGQAVADGSYTYKVKAKGYGGEGMDVDYRMSAKVTGLSFNDGKATLTLNKQTSIGVDEVLEVR